MRIKETIKSVFILLVAEKATKDCLSQIEMASI